MTKEEFIEEFNYLMSKTKISDSFYNDRCIRAINEFRKNLNSVIQSEIPKAIVSRPIKGAKVTYIGNLRSGYEHGMVSRTIAPDECLVPVVFNCGGDWGNSHNYTAVRVDKTELLKGWIKKGA